MHTAHRKLLLPRQKAFKAEFSALWRLYSATNREALAKRLRKKLLDFSSKFSGVERVPERTVVCTVGYNSVQIVCFS